MLLRRYNDRRNVKPEGVTSTWTVTPLNEVPVNSELDAVQDLVEELTEEVVQGLVGTEKDFNSMSVEELKAYAEEHGINLGRSTSHEGILKKIQEAAEKKSE